jgi:hypothetical protein
VRLLSLLDLRPIRTTSSYFNQTWSDLARPFPHPTSVRPCPVRCLSGLNTRRGLAVACRRCTPAAASVLRSCARVGLAPLVVPSHPPALCAVCCCSHEAALAVACHAWHCSRTWLAYPEQATASIKLRRAKNRSEPGPTWPSFEQCRQRSPHRIPVCLPS